MRGAYNWNAFSFFFHGCCGHTAPTTSLSSFSGCTTSLHAHPILGKEDVTSDSYNKKKAPFCEFFFPALLSVTLFTFRKGGEQMPKIVCVCMCVGIK